MRYLLTNVKNTWYFMKSAKSYYLDVLLMHGFLLFIFTPFLVNLAQYFLSRGGIAYISYDNIGMILEKHPIVFTCLIGVLLLLVVSIFFEFTFLLLSIYFIERREKISLRQLLKGTCLQLKKIRVSTLLFFLFYFFLVLPFSGIKFNSELLAKFQIPVFITDVIFANRFIIIALFILLYVSLIYLAIRFIFALPEMILNDESFKKSIFISWKKTKGHFLKIIVKFIIVMGIFAILSSISTSLIILIQYLVEENLPKYALGSAVVLMTLIQIVWLLNLVFTTVGIFFVIIDYMKENSFLPDNLSWYHLKPIKLQPTFYRYAKGGTIALLMLALVVFVGTYNADFLSNPSTVVPITISHRGVDNNNSVQNTIPALIKTSESTHPDYVEMDIQETKDRQFVVFHDFKLNSLTGFKSRPNQLALTELTQLTVKENGMEEAVDSFDDYLNEANRLNQKLMIEIKPTKDDSPDMIDTFLEKYKDDILTHGHVIQSLSFDIVEGIKTKAPEIVAGYIMPFSIVGPPEGLMDFFSIEYTTLNSNFVSSANKQGKKVYAWTPNDEETMSRMIFYGVDGIITDRMSLLNKVIANRSDITYSDKLLYFVIGLG